MCVPLVPLIEFDECGERENMTEWGAWDTRVVAKIYDMGETTLTKK
jgi:hypothetical protein